MDAFTHWNMPRFSPGTQAGHYESYFQRGNHPTRPLAFWIRYTIFSPKGHADRTEGELWAMWFDGEREPKRVVATYVARPWRECVFEPERFEVKIGEATLDGRGLRGEASSAGARIAWELAYGQEHPPLLLYPVGNYTSTFPKAKMLVPSPNCHYQGRVTVDGEAHDISGWPGTQSHNWGSKHTDLYAWGQVAGFEGAEDAAFDGATARLKLGPFWTPHMTPLVLRLDGEDYALNTPRQYLFTSRGRFGDWRWTFEGHDARIHVKGEMSAPKEAFAALDYRNPPGGVKRCLNSKIARCELQLRFADGRERRLLAPNRAAFEILGDPAMLEARGFR